MIQSIDRAIRVLFALQGARRMTLSELAGRLELPPSTVHGIVRTLVSQGMVVQEHGFGRYQLGPAEKPASPPIYPTSPPSAAGAFRPQSWAKAR